MGNNNNDNVTQREMSRILEFMRDDSREVKELVGDLAKQVTENVKHIAEIHTYGATLERLESKIEALDEKVSKITEQEIPKLKLKHAKLSTKSKVVMGAIMAGLSALVTLIGSIIENFF